MKEGLNYRCNVRYRSGDRDQTCSTRVQHRHPMGRAGFSEEMAAAVAFLVRMKPPTSPDKPCL